MRLFGWIIEIRRQEEASPVPVEHTEPAEVGKKRKFVHPTRGKQKVVFLHLLTGPCTIDDLVQTLKWNRTDVVKTLGGMVKAKFVLHKSVANEKNYKDNKGRVYFLTGAGMEAVRWFQHNPDMEVLPKKWKETVPSAVWR